jgi:hypothetical protein
MDIRSCRRLVIVTLPEHSFRLLLGATFELPGFVQKDAFELARAFAVTELEGVAHDLQLLQLSRTGLILRPTRLVIVREGVSRLRTISACLRTSGLHAITLIEAARAIGDKILDQASLTRSGHQMLPARAGFHSGMDEAIRGYHRR